MQDSTVKGSIQSLVIYAETLLVLLAFGTH